MRSYRLRAHRCPNIKRVLSNTGRGHGPPGAAYVGRCDISRALSTARDKVTYNPEGTSTPRHQRRVLPNTGRDTYSLRAHATPRHQGNSFKYWMRSRTTWGHIDPQHQQGKLSNTRQEVTDRLRAHRRRDISRALPTTGRGHVATLKAHRCRNISRALLNTTR